MEVADYVTIGSTFLSWLQLAVCGTLNLVIVLV